MEPGGGADPAPGPGGRFVGVRNDDVIELGAGPASPVTDFGPLPQLGDVTKVTHHVAPINLVARDR